MPRMHPIASTATTHLQLPQSPAPMQILSQPTTPTSLDNLAPAPSTSLGFMPTRSSNVAAARKAPDRILKTKSGPVRAFHLAAPTVDTTGGQAHSAQSSPTRESMGRLSGSPPSAMLMTSSNRTSPASVREAAMFHGMLALPSQEDLQQPQASSQQASMSAASLGSRASPTSDHVLRFFKVKAS